MRILIVIPNLTDPNTGGVGGAERNVYNIANYIVSSNKAVAIYTFYQNNYYGEINPAVTRFCKTIHIDRRTKLKWFLSWMRALPQVQYDFNKCIREWKPDIILSFLFHAEVVCFLAKCRFGKKILWIASERNYPPKRGKSKQQKIERMYKKTDLLVCQSEVVYEYYSGIRNKVILPNVIDFERLPYPESEKRSNKRIEIVSVGRLVDQKNFPLLLSAFAKAKECVNSPICLTIYGEGPGRTEFEELARVLKIEEEVSFPGFVTDLHDRIKNASIYITSSDFEGVSNAMLEAVYLGLPVITTDHPPGIAKKMINEGSGLVVPVGDVQAMADAISRLINDTDLRLQIRKHNTEKRLHDEKKNLTGTFWMQTLEDLFHKKE